MPDGIDKIYSWERLTGEKVEFATDIMSTTVTYWRPKVGSSVKRASGGTTPATTPVTTPKKRRNSGQEAREKIFRIIKASPTLSKMEIADLCGLKKEGVRYHIEILRKEVGLHWTGNSLNGRWKWEE